MKAAITIMVMVMEHEPTTFSNQATEVQVVFNLGGDNGSSKVVFNRVEEDQSILGSEAFMQPVSSTETMVGYFASTEQAGFDIDWGARWDSVKRRGSIVEHHDEEEGEEHDDHDDHELETMGVVFDDSALSASVLLSEDLSEALTACHSGRLQSVSHHRLLNCLWMVLT